MIDLNSYLNVVIKYSSLIDSKYLQLSVNSAGVTFSVDIKIRLKNKTPENSPGRIQNNPFRKSVDGKS
jgi:hypothetical protein